MKLRITAALLALASAQAGLADAPSSRYQLVWHDDFAGNALDQSKWTYRTDSKKLSTQLPANVVVRDHQLSLLMKKEQVNGKPYTGGGVISREQFGYGYYEVTARTTSNKGWHNSFWMMAGDGSDTYGPGHYLEIDQFEINTQKPGTVTSGLIFWNGKVGSDPIKMDRCEDVTSFDSSAGFHTYGADWREGAVDFYVDGRKYCTRAYPTNVYRQDPIRIWLTAIAYEAPVTVGGTPQLYRDVRFYRRDAYVFAGQAGYTESGGGWRGMAEGGFGLMPARITCRAGDVVRFAPDIVEAGKYRLSIWSGGDASQTGEADVTLVSPAMSVHRKTAFGGGKGRWIDLGEHSFSADNHTVISVRTVRGCLPASAMKAVRVD